VKTSNLTHMHLLQAFATGPQNMFYPPFISSYFQSLRLCLTFWNICKQNRPEKVIDLLFSWSK
jgi:hypothetical protein